MTVCTFREDGHGGPVVRHHHCAAFNTRQHHVSLGVSGHDDVTIRAKHRARTIRGLDDIMVLPPSTPMTLPSPSVSTTLPLGVPGRDDVASGVQHHARTVYGFGDVVTLLVDSEDIAIALPVGQHHVALLSSASPGFDDGVYPLVGSKRNNLLIGQHHATTLSVPVPSRNDEDRRLPLCSRNILSLFCK